MATQNPQEVCPDDNRCDECGCGLTSAPQPGTPEWDGLCPSCHDRIAWTTGWEIQRPSLSGYECAVPERRNFSGRADVVAEMLLRDAAETEDLIVKLQHYHRNVTAMARSALRMAISASKRHAPDRRSKALYVALDELVTRCDGEDGVRADGSNINTQSAHVVLDLYERW